MTEILGWIENQFFLSPKNLYNIFLSVKSVKKPIKTKTRTLAEIESKLHGISINQPKFYMTALCKGGPQI
jgi:hypothetical protein